MAMSSWRLRAARAVRLLAALLAVALIPYSVPAVIFALLKTSTFTSPNDRVSPVPTGAGSVGKQPITRLVGHVVPLICFRLHLLSG